MNILLFVILTMNSIEESNLCALQNESKAIKSIEIVYVYWGIESFTPMKCEELDFRANNPMVGRLIILQDRDYFNRVHAIVQNLAEFKTQDIPDARIKVIVNYTDDTRDILCIGHNNVLTLNSKTKKYDTGFEKLIRSTIPLSYYEP